MARPLLCLVLVLLLAHAVSSKTWFPISMRQEELGAHVTGRKLMAGDDDMIGIARSIARNAYKKFKSSDPNAPYDGHVPKYGELCAPDPVSGETPIACWKTYALFIAVLLTAGVILGVLALGGCVVFFGCIRYPCCCRCLGTCGSRVPSKGICFVKPKRFTGYKPKEVRIFKILLICVSACVIVLIIPLWVGQSLYLRGASIKEAEKQANIVLRDVTSLLPTFYYSPFATLQANTQPDLAEFNFYARQFADILPLVTKNTELVVHISSIPFWTTTAAILIIAIIALLTAFIPSIRLFLYPVAITALLWCGIFFFIFAWYLTFGVAAADVCKYAADSTRQDRETSLLKAVSSYCIATYPNATTDSTGHRLQDELETFRNGFDTLRCQMYNSSATPDSYFPCNSNNSPYVDCSGPTAPGCSNVGGVPVFIEGSNRLTVDQCAVSCTNVTLRRFANNILTINAFTNQTKTLTDAVLPLLQCSYYIDKADAVRKSVCPDLLAGSVVMLVVSPIEAFFCFALFVIAIMAVKRFNVDNQIIEASGMEMSPKGSAASPRDSTKVEKPGKPKLEPEIVRTMRDREAAATAAAAASTAAAASAAEPAAAEKPAAGSGAPPVVAVAPVVVAYPDPSPPESQEHSEADEWPRHEAATAHNASLRPSIPPGAEPVPLAVAPAAAVSEPPPAYEAGKPVAWHEPPPSFVDEPAPVVARAPAAIPPSGASPGGSQVSGSASASRSASRSGSFSSSGSGSGSASSSGSGSGSGSRSGSSLGAPPVMEAPPPPYEP